MVRNFLLASFSLGLVSCSQTLPLGPVNMMVIQPVGPYCQYQVSSAPLQTMEDISQLQGLLGRVVFHPNDVDSDPDILQLGLGFQSLDLRLSGSGYSFAPLNKDSLLGVSLYYAIEKGYLLFKNLDSAGDIFTVVPNMRETYLVENTKMKDSAAQNSSFSDNAAYIQVNGSNGPRNYFLHFPNENISALPLGFNAGVLVHEYAHMVVQYLFHNKRSQAGMSLSTGSENTLGAFEEGFADYFGFLATNDPTFFHCSFPGTSDGDRDLSHAKSLTSDQLNAINTSLNFDPHDGGAVWASAQYQIAQLIGPEANGRSLVQFINNLASCTHLDSSQATINFNVLRDCHLQALGSNNSPAIQQIYQAAFSRAGGF